MENEGIRKARESEVFADHFRTCKPIGQRATSCNTPGRRYKPYAVEVDKHEASFRFRNRQYEAPGSRCRRRNVQAIVRLVQMAFKGLSDQKDYRQRYARADAVGRHASPAGTARTCSQKQQRDEERFFKAKQASSPS